MQKCVYCSDKCSHFSSKIKNKCILGRGNVNAKLMIIGESPSSQEDLADNIIVNNVLKSLLMEFDIDENEVYWTYAIKCYVPPIDEKKDKKPSKKDIKVCEQYLLDEIRAVAPHVILALGATPLFVLLAMDKITKVKNNVFYSEKYNVKVVPTFNPMYILRNPSEYTELKKGFELAVSEMEDKELTKKDTVERKHIVLNSVSQVHKILDKLDTVSKFVIDLETTSLNTREAKILCVAISFAEGTGITIPWDLLSKNDDCYIKFYNLMKKEVLKIGHNIKFDIEVLEVNSLEVNGPFFDTMIASHLLDENMGHGLDDCALKYTEIRDYWGVIDNERKKEAKKRKMHLEDVHYGLIDQSILFKYACWDVDTTITLYNIFVPKLKEEELYDFMMNFPMEYMNCIIEMETRGIKIDKEMLEKLVVKYKNDLQEVEKDLYADVNVQKYQQIKRAMKEKELSDKYLNSKLLQNRYPNGIDHYIRTSLSEEDYKFNFSSPKQLRELFFDQMRLSVSKKTDTGAASTDESVLIEFSEKGVELAKYILKYRSLAKYISKELMGILNNLDKNARIHTSYLQHSTVSGRISSKSPNLQNLNRDAVDVKNCFLADEGFSFVKSDLAQAEFRAWAHYANDKELISDIESGLDIHRRTAAKIWGIEESEVTKDQRTAAKNCVFGLLYGRGATAISKQYAITMEQANSIRELFFTTYPVATEWLEHIQYEAMQTGKVKTWFGRIRHLPKIYSNDAEEKAEALRQATNSPIQGQASDMNNSFMCKTLKNAREAGIECYPALTIHDDNTYLVKDSYISSFISILQDVVHNSFPDWKVRMDVEIKVGKRLGSCVEYKI